MNGEKNLDKLLKTLKPVLNEGEFVFCSVSNDILLNPGEILGFFNEKEGKSIVIKKSVADRLGLNYSFVAAWITLTGHSSLEAVGLTATFAKALSEHNISCNVVAAYYHDHIFVAMKDAKAAIDILTRLSSDS